MKKLFFFIPAFLFCSLSLFAQPDSEKWKTFSPPQEEFSVEVPGSLTANSFSTNNENRRYTGLIYGTYYFIFSDDKKEDHQYKTVLKFVESNRKNELEKQKQSATMKFSFSDDENFYHTIYTVKTTNRFYAFHLVSDSEDDPAVNRFFKSLKITEQTLADDIDKSKTEDRVADTDPVVIQKLDSNEEKSGQGMSSGQGSGVGSGRGQGTGMGTGQGTGFGNTGNDKTKTSNDENIQNKPMKITYKAKPQYTDFARFYNITGNVRVRTTFLKDGTIGSTTAFSKLPFGLTNSALRAAKQMRFEPQIAKGQGVSITRVVVFTFTIY